MRRAKGEFAKNDEPLTKGRHELSKMFFCTTNRFQVVAGEINCSVLRKIIARFNCSAKKNEKSVRSAKKKEKHILARFTEGPTLNDGMTALYEETVRDSANMKVEGGRKRLSADSAVPTVVNNCCHEGIT